MTTTINIDHPLFNTRDERLRIQRLLRHLGSGADLREFPVSASQKVALVKTANQRGLIAWHKARDRYELTPAGWCELAPSRRFGVGSMVLGTTAGATLGAVVLATFWLTAGAAHRPPMPRPVVPAAPAQVAKASTPAASAPATTPAPAEQTPTTTAPTGPTPTPASAALPTAVPVEPPPTKVAYEPTSEERAEEAAKAKQVAAAKKQAAQKEKARQRAAARRKREEAARAWAGTEPRSRQAEYSGYGGYGSKGYGGYGGQNSWFAYR